MPEVEAKFLIRNPEQFDDVLDALETLGYTVTKDRTETLIDRYFDTPDWSVLRAGWSLRCREHGRRKTLTLKAVESKPGPVFVREEIDQPLVGVREITADLPPGPVEERLRDVANGSGRRELFRIRNRRSTYDLNGPEEDHRITLSFDRARLSVTDSSSPSPPLDFNELELELTSGEVDALEHLAGELQDRTGLVPAQLSKFERGMQAIGVSAPELREQPQRPPLGPDGSLLELVYHHLDHQLHALKLQQPRAWEGLQPEGVHQMRVAIRRIRSVLRAHRRMLPGETVAHLNEELRWLARQLGGVRDADVYWEAFHHFRESLPEKDANALAEYEQHLESKREDARTALIEALASDRYTEVVAELERFVAAGPPTPVLRRFGAVRVSDGADLFIRPVMEQMFKLGARIDAEAPAKKLHKLRIEGKRLRYLLEFFGEIEPKRWARPLKAARRLQDVLGEHQDAFLARERLQAYARDVPLKRAGRESLLALGRLLQREEDRLSKGRRRFPKVWRQFVKGVSDA